MSNLRSGLAVGAALLVACAGRAPRTQPLPSGTMSFIARGDADSVLQGTFEGKATLKDNWITVEISSAVFDLGPGESEKWRNLTLRAFIALDYSPSLWRTPAESRPVNVWRYMNFAKVRPEDRKSLAVNEPLRFLVPVPPGASLATSRLGFEAEWTFAVGKYGETESRFAFAPPLVFR